MDRVEHTTGFDLDRELIAKLPDADVVTRSSAKRFGRWFEGKFGWVFEDVRPLRRPVPVLGQLGLYRASSTLKRAVKRQLP